jgi:hypothetical protein
VKHLAKSIFPPRSFFGRSQPAQLHPILRQEESRALPITSETIRCVWLKSEHCSPSRAGVGDWPRRKSKRTSLGVDISGVEMVRVKMSFDASRVKTKGAAFKSSLESKLKARSSGGHAVHGKNAAKPLSRDERARQLRRTFEPVAPGFFDYIERRQARRPGREIFLTSKKIGRYKVDFPNMSDNDEEIEKFPGEAALLGQPVGPPGAYNEHVWTEPHRLVVPQDSFERLLDKQERAAAQQGKSVFTEAWRRLVGVTLIAIATPIGLRRIFGSEAVSQAGAEIRQIARDAAKDAGLR